MTDSDKSDSKPSQEAKTGDKTMAIVIGILVMLLVIVWYVQLRVADTVNRPVVAPGEQTTATATTTAQ
jgi:hypothetical protein